MDVCFGNFTFSFGKVEAKGFPQYFAPLVLGVVGCLGDLGGERVGGAGPGGTGGAWGSVKSHGHLFCRQNST